MTTLSSVEVVEVEQPEAAEVKGFTAGTYREWFQFKTSSRETYICCTFWVLPWYPRWSKADAVSLEMVKV